MATSTIMIIVWASLMAIALLIEVFTYDLVSIFFVPAALPSLLLAVFEVDIAWQIVSFIVLAIVFILAFRPLLKKWLIKETIPTNITDVNYGKKVRLLQDTVDGHSTIKVNDVTWRAKVTEGGDLPKDSLVEIVSSESNKFLVKIASE
ncbi:MAG: NfeD family protein [Firmicutes bacterium]|nr:NfeD family protein [Bacillota bacterium]